MKQIESALDTEIYFQAEPKILKFHPMSAAVGASTCDAVERHMKCSTRLHFVSKTAEDDSTQFVVGCVQIFSNKSQTSLKAGGLRFNPLYITLLDFTDHMRRLQILSGNIIVVYLSVSFHTDFERKKKFKPLSKCRRRTAF